ncbi:MAG: hypothetical protein KDM81_21335 [Verrucomicrobiae bacterium]|nr:hypothetical protein [Verrucomicrobiae bacterium]MCP5519649.1 hypothetical protein [Verrucomicrobiales bacterium]MCP5528044.1 hypothetical protein [Verrucomicrobiales bacterium]
MTASTEPTVSFHISEAYGGFADCRGVARAAAEGLHLEFQTKDGFLGILKSGVRSQVLFWEDLVDVAFRAGLFRARIELVARSLKTLGDMPGAEGCRLHLGVRRQDRAAGRELASFATLRICENDLRRMQAEMKPQAG